MIQFTPYFADCLGDSTFVIACSVGFSLVVGSVTLGIRTVLATSSLQKLTTSLAWCIDCSGSTLVESWAFYLKRAGERLDRDLARESAPEAGTARPADVDTDDEYEPFPIQFASKSS